MNKCLHPLFYSFMRSCTNGKSGESLILFTMGSAEIKVVWYFGRTSCTPWSWSFSLFFLSEKKAPSLYVFPPIYKRGRSFLSSFLSNSGFVNHYFFTFVAASICHLSCYHFPKMGCFTSDTELIKDDIIDIESFCLALCRLRL